MKKLLIGLLMIGTVSTFANEDKNYVHCAYASWGTGFSVLYLDKEGNASITFDHDMNKHMNAEENSFDAMNSASFSKVEVVIRDKKIARLSIKHLESGLSAEVTDQNEKGEVSLRGGGIAFQNVATLRCAINNSVF